MNRLHSRLLNWRLKNLGYDTYYQQGEIIYICTKHSELIDFNTFDYKNLFRRFFIKYISLYRNVHGNYVVRLE